MAHIKMAGNTITYAEAADFGVKSLLDPVIVSQGTVGNFKVKMRLAFEDKPELIAECFDLANNKVWYAPFPEAMLDELFEETRKRHVVGLTQPHLAQTLARWVATSRFDPEYMEARLLAKIA